MTGVCFSIHPTPVGDALLVFTSDGLIGLDLLAGPLGPALDGWGRRLGALPHHDDQRGSSAADQLDEYFEGRRTAFDLPIDWSPVSGFARGALQAIAQIPYGETASYGEIAAVAGSHRAHRAVGSACRSAPVSIVVPVHRVVRSDGSIGEYGGREDIKRRLLDLERRPAGDPGPPPDVPLNATSPSPRRTR